jgi:transposase
MREELIASRTGLINCVRGWARTRLLRIRMGQPETLPRRVRATALAQRDGLPEYVERVLVVIESLNEQIALADKELRQLAQRDPLCERLMSVPGVGPVTSLRFAAALDDASRFPTSHSVQAYLGLTPGENSSSQRHHRTSITKAGPAPVRRALVQAAWSLRRCRPADPITKWAAEIEQRRGKCIATVAVARKLAGVLYALWRDGTRYEANHASAKNAAAA